MPCPLLMLCYGHATVDCIEVPAVLFVAELVVWCSKLWLLGLLAEESTTMPCPLLMLCFATVDCIEVPVSSSLPNSSFSAAMSCAAARAGGDGSRLLWNFPMVAGVSSSPHRRLTGLFFLFLLCSDLLLGGVRTLSPSHSLSLLPQLLSSLLYTSNPDSEKETVAASMPPP